MKLSQADLWKRDREIIAAIEAGEFLRVIGSRYGISRQRVRQIGEAHDVYSQNRRRITAQELARYAVDYYNGVPFSQMSKTRSGKVIADALARAGIHKPMDIALLAWSDDETKVLKSLWGKQSCSEIARVLGTTKNAVIGRAYRLGLKRLDPIAARREAANAA